jgi:hypothetical protein
MATITPTPAGWYGDPTRRHEYRYWDAADWTENVSDRGITGIDPVALAPPVPTVSAAAPVAPAPARTPTVSASPPTPAPPPMASPTSLPLPSPAAGVEAREIAVPETRRFYAGQVVFMLGNICFLVIGTVGWFLSLGARASGSAPAIFLGSRGGTFVSEWYVPGILLAAVPFVLLTLQTISQKVDRRLKDRRSRESLTAQLGLPTSWRYTTAYQAKSFRHRLLPVIGSALALLFAVGLAVAISGDGFTLAPGVFVLIAGGVLTFVGTLIQRSTPYRRVRVDSTGQVFDAG